MTAENWKNRLNLQPHPEGGYYSEVYRNSKSLELVSGRRNLATSIYFMLEGNDKSHFHQLYSDELWYYHAGSPLILHYFKDGKYQITKLGLDSDCNLQIVIEAGTIFAAEVVDKKSYTLMGCMVNPGFDFQDFKLLEKAELLKLFPDYPEIINEFTLTK